MPPPGKGSGGHMDIFRFIQALENAGHSCTIYLYSYENPATIAQVIAEMGDSYPRLKAKMYWLRGGKMAPADAIFATSWDTAYPVYNDPSNAKRFYMIQDFEPYFYQVGGLYLLAENTYRFGFYGITLGPWIAKKLKPYRMKADFVDIGVDAATYKFDNRNRRKEILFYARPYTGRRGFEIGILALDLFHRKHPGYKINMLGYDVSQYDIPFPYENLKVLEHDQLNELYNRCAAGLVMSLTNMSLLPLELLACGAIPVVNDGENNRMVSDNKFIEYSAGEPAALAEALSQAVSRKTPELHAKKASESVEGDSWEDAGKKFIKIVEDNMQAKGKG